MKNHMDVENPQKDSTTDFVKIRKRRLAWWKKARKPEAENKILRITTLILVVCLVLAIILFYIRYQKSDRPEPLHEVCLSENCVQSAAEIISKLDRSVQPCDDFYNFACGTFIRNLILPDDKSYITPLSYARDVLTQKLRYLVEDKIVFQDSNSSKLAKNLYKSCMDTDRINSRGTKPIQEILSYLGGWPVVQGSKWKEEEFDLLKTLYKIREYGFSTDYLFALSANIDMKNSSWRIIGFEQAELGMPSRDYMVKGIDDQDVQSYLSYQVNLAVALGASRERAEKELRDNVIFEIEIANYSLSEADRRDIEKLYNKMTIQDLQEMVPNLPWVEITNKFIKTDPPVDENEPIIVGVPDFMVKVGQLIERKSKRELANYLLWHVSATSAPYLSEEIRQIQFQYTKSISGVAKIAPRWKFCMDLVSDELPYAIGALYVRNFFNEESKTEAENMVDYIHNTFNDNLETLKWMDSETRQQALKKSKAIKPLIGYPQELLNETILQKHHSGLTITKGELLSNIRNMSLYKRHYEDSRLRKKIVKSDWKIYGDAAVVNAFYSPFDNAILFPAGILQGIFFNVNRPKYLNYGSIGFVIGHEITHGFDDEGSQFNEHGDLQDWWDGETREKFLSKSKCIVEQYNNYTVPEVGLNLNGIVTQGENIADNGGIKGSYRAYEKWTIDNGKEQTLPGMNYTANQLFWISAAHLWCSKERTEHLKLSILSKQHAIPRFRINGPMSNLFEFSKDWNCPLGSPMNPVEKCSVW